MSRSLPEHSIEELYPHEDWWRDHYHWLKSKGYELRLRYRPGWKPSWEGTDKSYLRCEDHIDTFSQSTTTLDARRLSDGKQVSLKHVDRDSREKIIMEFFSLNNRQDEPHNHCVPLLDVFDDDDDEYACFIVMPLLRIYDSPEFESVDEALEFVRQTLEGLIYMHDLNVAHRDLGRGNIMLDAPDMFPKGFHAIMQDFVPDFSDTIVYHRRRHVQNLKYRFIDFGVSSAFDSFNARENVLGKLCQDQTVPELRTGEKYDPFKVDIYTLGNVYKRTFIQEHANLAFLSPLLEAMTQHDPAVRPDAEAAMKHLEGIVSKRSYMSKQWRLTPSREKSTLRATVFRGLGTYSDEIYYQMRRLKLTPGSVDDTVFTSMSL